MQVIGLTGGIASGKSTVSRILKNAGAVIIDADQIARNVVKKGLPAYREIIATFGDKVLAPDGDIDRSVLGDIIFNDPQKKEMLNRIVHPYVISALFLGRGKSHKTLGLLIKIPVGDIMLVVLVFLAMRHVRRDDADPRS